MIMVCVLLKFAHLHRHLEDRAKDFSQSDLRGIPRIVSVRSLKTILKFSFYLGMPVPKLEHQPDEYIAFQKYIVWGEKVMVLRRKE